MNNESAICAKCEHGVSLWGEAHSPRGIDPRFGLMTAVCEVNVKAGVDFITGKSIKLGTVMCFEKNSDGECKDFERVWADPDVKSDYLVRSDDPKDYCSICDCPTQRRWVTRKVLGCINNKCDNFYRREKGSKV